MELITIHSVENLNNNKGKPKEQSRVCELSNQISAVLFASGDGISIELLCQKLGVSKKECEKALEFVAQQFGGNFGIHLVKYRNNYQFTTNPNYANEVSLVLNKIRERNLTRASLETLAIIAYKQPITRAEIDQIRGVGSDYAIQILGQSNLIEVVGRKDVLGKPLLYGTTETFLKRFEIENLKDLPDYDELLNKIKVIKQEEIDLYDSHR
ncbi:MAG: SMC-Scp complex subunit ScpB [Christensenellaceae bacterium]|jgi:segregation and condensation protein B|nr:SMC-Scp complex subunit ScpB [Christensenellaceae bacterium]